MTDETGHTADTSPSGSTLDVDEAVRMLGDRIALIKAHVLGGDAGRVADSNAMPWADAEQREQVFAGMGVVTPPYDPETLAILFENSSSLRQNVDAYVTNIDAFGHRFEPVIDLDASDADHRIANALFVERQRKKSAPRFRDDPKVQALANTPTPDEVAAKKAEVTEHMRLEKSRLETFFEFACIDLSFVTLRRRTRQDLEMMGNGYWEVLRDGGGELAQFVYLPGFTMRLLPLDAELVEDDLNIKVSELSFDTMKVRRRFRRYVQVFEQQVVFFKEFGDPRCISRKSGRAYASIDELVAADPDDGPATEVLHFKIHNARSAYGIPRWIGNLLAVLGSRQAEEVNYLYFENKSVPPLALLVSGGRLSAQSIPRIESYIENNIKGKRNFHRVLVIEAESSSGGSNHEHTGRMRIELKPLTNAQQSDATHLAYDERNHDKVGQSFRLPRLLRGDIRDFNRSCYSADTETLTENGWKLHQEIAEDERIAVYDPERDELRFEVPVSKHVSFVREDLIRFVGKHTDVLVTRDHKMLVRCPDRSWTIEPAEETARRRVFEFICVPGTDAAGEELIDLTLPKVCKIERGHRHEPIRGDLWIEFLGYFMSDGGLLETDHPTAPYLVFVRQKKRPYRTRMQTCLELIGWKFSTQIKEDGTHVFCISNRCLRDWLVTHCGGRSAGRHLPWSYVTGLPVRQLRILFRAMMDGDGTRTANLRGGSYYTASSVLAGQVQAMCLRLGYRAHYRWVAQTGVFRVQHVERWSTIMTSARHVEVVPYEGEVYCYFCPGAGFFVTRRNGKVAIQGNTGDAALMFAEMQVFQPEREEFDFVINRKILADMGIRFWRFRSNSPVTRDPAAMAEIVRSLTNANILTPEEGRLLASDVFNREFKKISAAWVKQPVALTLAGIAAAPEPESTLAGPDVQKGDTTTGDLAAAGGIRAPAQGQGPGGRRRRGTPDLVDEAARLIAIRNALRDAEGREAQRAFESDKRAELELEREVIKVPADELASWFEPESTPSPP